MCLTFVQVEPTDEDYEAFVEISNTEFDVPRTAEDVRIQDRLREPGTLLSREFVLFDGRRIGTATAMQLMRVEAEGCFSLGVNLLPDYRDRGHEEPIYVRLLGFVVDHGGRRVTTFVRDDRKSRCDALTRLGFEYVMRDPVTRLDLERFDPAPHEATIREVQRQGIAIRSVADLIAGGVDWLPKMHDLVYEVLQDVPMPERPRRSTLEKFRERMTNERFWFPEGWIVALDGDKWVGVSDLRPVPAKREMAMTGLTGVVRTHRRRGIATALKVTALERAKRAGVLSVETANEENNPMLQLNIRLGFREVFAMLIYRKTL